jgi:hypothetical protein
MEDPEIIARLRADPRGLLDSLKLPVILDEVQNVPEVFAMVRARIDRHPRKLGQWLLTGSQEAPLMQNVTESMAGRAALLQLMPLSARESPRVNMLRGGYPEVIARPKSASLWFSSYLQTYLERDVRSIMALRDLGTFRRFISVLATRHGQVLNRSEIAAPLGVSVPTISQWLGVLETTLQIMLVQPFYENLGKRLLKSPKLYFCDPGMVCHLLGIENERDLRRSPFLGSIFEGFVASEAIKAQLNSGGRRELYYFRDQQGLEVDFVMPARGGGLHLIEAKASRTVLPRMADPMRKVAAAMPERLRKQLQMTIVHERSPSSPPLESVAPGVKAMPWQQWLQRL